MTVCCSYFGNDSIAPVKKKRGGLKRRSWYGAFSLINFLASDFLEGSSVANIQIVSGNWGSTIVAIDPCKFKGTGCGIKSNDRSIWWVRLLSSVNLDRCWHEASAFNISSLDTKAILHTLLNWSNNCVRFDDIWGLNTPWLHWWGLLK